MRGSGVGCVAAATIAALVSRACGTDTPSPDLRSPSPSFGATSTASAAWSPAPIEAPAPFVQSPSPGLREVPAPFSTACPSTCLFKSCTEWVASSVNTCAGLEMLGCDCTGCDCGQGEIADVFWTELDNWACGVESTEGPVDIGHDGADFDIMEIGKCMDWCAQNEECGGIWHDKAEGRCTYVADTSIGQYKDPWSSCYSLHRDQTLPPVPPDDAQPSSTTTTTAAAGKVTGGTNPKVTAAPKEVCQTGCITNDRTCEDWASYYSCSDLESKIGCDCSYCSCPVDCVGEWSAWETCDATCGAGSTSRTFEIAVRAVNGGLECEIEDGEVESTDCSAMDPDDTDSVLNCPVDCSGHWLAWGECTTTCGTQGTKERSFAVEIQPKYGGDACPVSQVNGCSGLVDCMCPKTCIVDGYTCDDWLETSADWTCSALESAEYSCDCTACLCDAAISGASGSGSDADCDDPDCSWWTCVC